VDAVAEGLTRAGYDVHGAEDDRPFACTVIVAESYHDERLAAPNAEALRSGVPWLLCRATRRGAWVGPWIVPFRSACAACLGYAVRLAAAESIAVRAVGVSVRAPVDGSCAASRLTLARAVADQLTRALALGTRAPTVDTIIEHDAESGATAVHPVRRRPQCPWCGDGTLYTRQAGAPLHARATAPESPAAWLARTSPLVDRVCGLVAAIERVEAPPPVHVYTAGANVVRPGAGLRELYAQSLWHNVGKGRTADAARAGALGEAIERASLLRQGDEPRERATLHALGDRAIHPNACMLFSEAQYAERDAWNACDVPTAYVPLSLDPDRQLDWSPVWSLTHGTQRWLPTSYLYFGDDEVGDGHLSVVACANGVAAGSSLDDALRRALLELVERDAVAIWWENRLQRPELPLEIGFAREARDAWAGRGRSLWALDLTTDLGVPVAAAVGSRDGGELLFGFGAGASAKDAVERAICELGQVETALGTGDGAPLGRWLRQATLAEHPYLAPHGASVPNGPAPNETDDGWCRRQLERRGYEVLALDLTRPDLGAPVVRAIVPGLRHFWPRHAPGRLYDVPVALGWRSAPLGEAALNPQSFVL
jgi:ribosomal protein S12 methylthiotransferase accessory factor